MSLRIRLTPAQLADFRQVLDSQNVDIDRLIERVEVNEGRIHRPEELVSAAATVIGQPGAGALIRQTLALQALARQSSAREDDVFAALSKSLEESQLANEALPDEISALVALIRRVFSLSEIRKTGRAIELSYDFASLLQSTRILTDVRPLFSDNAKEIDGTVIAHTLRVRYESGNQENELSLAVDENDLRRLIEQCERSLEKAKTVQREICARLNLPTINSDGPNE